MSPSTLCDDMDYDNFNTLRFFKSRLDLIIQPRHFYDFNNESLIYTQLLDFHSFFIKVNFIPW